MKKRTVSALTLSSLYLCSAAWAGEVVELSTECESALALSAAPTYMRDKAGIYVLGQDGYEKIRTSENGFACMVTREGPMSVVPQCFDPIGQTVHMKVAKDEAKKMRAGMSRADIRKERVQGFYDGTYTPAKGHGVVYMASAFNYIDLPNRRIHVAPHVMYHAPGVTNADLGSVPQEAFQNKGMPFMANSGPMGFMIGFTEKATDSGDVHAKCKGQLPDRNKFMPFPPK